MKSKLNTYINLFSTKLCLLFVHSLHLMSFSSKTIWYRDKTFVPQSKFAQLETMPGIYFKIRQKKKKERKRNNKSKSETWIAQWLICRTGTQLFSSLNFHVCLKFFKIISNALFRNLSFSTD